MVDSIMFWNVQGAASPNFRRSFRTLVKTYKPSMVAIFEPRINGIKANEFIRRSGFNKYHRVEATGFSGIFSWVTTIYASPSPCKRRDLWSHLERLATTVQGPWLMGGDFNSIIYASEKRGGSSHRSGICGLFRTWLHSNRLYDLQFKGPKFTWSRGTLAKRLDRAVCNEDWTARFTENTVLHLPKIASDHRPVLVRFEKVEERGRGNKPFWFLAAWLIDKGFQNLVNSSWGFDDSYLEVVQRFTTNVSLWNKNTFGNIFHKKRNLLARIGGIQRVLETCTKQSLVRLELKLKVELEQVLTQEELLWHQK
ncbi:uncharacterized protein LOC127901861 [Citrus sinensis]|uniref:uncharacterized protein LOC112099091 n=1 Tax=Citrus clementina TaxID=85681 RepID=UPI000CED2D5B|nr:uncharacterized protein LOC112099091 [Citrus x clementina]XP_052295847.1 uncharacterized protein LOC127901861 [Citrus sinensis]